MKSNKSGRRRRVLIRRGLRAVRAHSLSLVSAAIIAGLAMIALSSDAFQSYRTPPDATMGARLTWAPPATVDPEVAATYVSALAGLSPLERARLRPPSPRRVGSEPFPVTLPHLSGPEVAEVLLTARSDADALGLQFQLMEP